jgi:hypothetical protein
LTDDRPLFVELFQALSWPMSGGPPASGPILSSVLNTDEGAMNVCRCAIPTLLITATLSGCSEKTYEGAQRIPLKGKVTVDGRPMDAGTISFEPLDSAKQRPSGGSILNGVYNVEEPMGANAGSYRVVIHWQKPTGKKIKAIDSDEVVEQRAEGLPAKYHKNTELTAEISPDKTEFDFDLSTK